MKEMKTHTPNVRNEMRRLHSATLSAEDIPRRVLVAPWGAVESSSGSFVVDEESARLAVAAFDEHGTDLPIDYEHQTLGGAFASPSGQAPAAGWIKRLIAEPGVGLVAEIEWTQQASERLAAKEYRYLSPVAIIRKNDRKLVALHSAALTNKPAIVGMTPIVNREGGGLDGAELEPLDRLRRDLALPCETEADQVLLAASERLLHLQQAQQRQRIEERITEALRAGKLVEAQRDWAEALVAKEEELFDEWFRTAPVIVPTGRTLAPHSADPLERRCRASAAAARAEFRTNRFLAGLTSEEAYVAHATRTED
jgi:hypothetical protein